MPLTADIQVNGKTIAHVFIRNCGRVGPGRADLRRYDYEFLVNDTWQPVKLTGSVRHGREDGAVALVAKVLEDATTDAPPDGRKLGFLS